MKKGRYSEDQMVNILREADKAPVAEVAKRNGVSEASIYTWRQRYGELDVSDVRRLKQLEQDDVQEALISRAQDAQERLTHR